jgi:phage baseplate assembly protein gpV
MELDMYSDNRSFLHQGQTSERDIKNASARVAMDDFNGTVSGKLQVLFPAIGGWNMFFTPKEGDQVVIARLPNGQEEGYVLGKVYTANKMPQNGAPNIILLVSDDGKNFFRFDADKGTLDLTVDQDGKLKFKNLDIEVDEHMHIKTKTYHLEVEDKMRTDVGGDKDTSIGGNVNTNVTGTTIVKSSAVTIQAPVTIVGNTNISSSLSVAGDITNGGNMSTGGVHTDSIGKHDA